MEEKIIFPSVVDGAVRQTLMSNIVSLPCLIPLLWTFFEMLKYIEPCCDILKGLIGGKLKKTIRASLEGCYFPPYERVIQTSNCGNAILLNDINA